MMLGIILLLALMVIIIQVVRKKRKLKSTFKSSLSAVAIPYFTFTILVYLIDNDSGIFLAITVFLLVSLLLLLTLEGIKLIKDIKIK